MSFPERNWFGIPKGRQDRGEVESIYLGKGVFQTRCCRDCKSNARIGRENNLPFVFCPKCLVKLSKPKEKE